jgi:hypothetical protein
MFEGRSSKRAVGRVGGEVDTCDRCIWDGLLSYEEERF